LEENLISKHCALACGFGQMYVAEKIQTSSVEGRRLQLKENLLQSFS
jgi:hypothetical protein